MNFFFVTINKTVDEGGFFGRRAHLNANLVLLPNFESSLRESGKSDETDF